MLGRREVDRVGEELAAHPGEGEQDGGLRGCAVTGHPTAVTTKPLEVGPERLRRPCSLGAQRLEALAAVQPSRTLARDDVFDGGVDRRGLVRARRGEADAAAVDVDQLHPRDGEAVPCQQGNRRNHREVEEVAVADRVDERLLDHGQHVEELEHESPARRQPPHVGRERGIEVVRVHEMVHVHDEVGRPVLLDGGETGVEKGREPGRSVRAVELDDGRARRQRLVSEDLGDGGPGVVEGGLRVDRHLGLGVQPALAPELHEVALLAHVQPQRPRRVGRRVVGRRELVGCRHLTEVEHGSRSRGVAGATRERAVGRVLSGRHAQPLCRPGSSVARCRGETGLRLQQTRRGGS